MNGPSDIFIGPKRAALTIAAVFFWKENKAMTESQKAKIIKLRADGNGCRAIASKLGMSVNTVKSFCKRNNINTETAAGLTERHVTQITRCENCGKEVQQIKGRRFKRFCSDQCRAAWWNRNLDLVKRKAYYTIVCKHCGKEFQVYGDKRRKYCSYECYIADRFQGGERHD